MSSFEIRSAIAGDARTIAALNLDCWRETYEGLVPAETMADLTLEERISYWTTGLADADAARPSVFLAIDEGAPVGFACWRPHLLALRGRLGRGAEISAIYLLRRAQRQGMGRALMVRMAQEMRASGANWAALQVLRDNLPARRFYESLGGRRFGTETDWRGVPQLAYGWRDLARLTNRA